MYLSLALAHGSISLGSTDFVSGVPATGRINQGRQGHQPESDWGCRHLWHVVSAAGMNGGLCSSHWDETGGCVRCSCWGDWGEQSKWEAQWQKLEQDCGPQFVYLLLAPGGCWSVLYLTQTWCAWEQTSSWTSQWVGGPRFGQRVCAGLWGWHTSVGCLRCLCECMHIC